MVHAPPQPGIASCTHPVAGLQLSVVHALSSLHTTVAPPWQMPPPQVSPEVQAFPSSQGAVLLVKTQPVAGLQLSLVQALSSLHTTVAPPWQVPPPQVSPEVQAFPSSQGAVLLLKTHPVAGLQLSVVQALSSLHVTVAPPWQVPPPQVSPEVQAFPSSQGAVLLLKTHPVAGLQLSLVQALSSLHTTVAPPWQVPPPQLSPEVQAFPSSQGAVLSVKTQPVAGSQVSVVQAFPSSQAAVLSVKTQPVAGSQVSVVQAFESSHARAGPPTQTPAPLHASFVVQALASVHDEATASN